MGENKYATIFFSGKYEQITQIADKTRGSFYYAQDKDAWYSYFGNPLRLRRISDIYQCETDQERIELTTEDLFESKLYIVKETGTAWWNETGSPDDWLVIGNKTLLRDSDEELIDIDTTEPGTSKFYSTDRLRDIVTKVDEIELGVKDGEVTLAKMAALPSKTIIGNDTAEDGTPKALDTTGVLTMLDVEKGANKYEHPDHSGDVTSTGDGLTIIVDEAVTLNKMAKLQAISVIGNDTDKDGIPKALTPDKLLTLLGVEENANNYIHPNHTGHVTSTSDGLTAITDGVVSLAKMSELSPNSVIGNDSDKDGIPKALTQNDLLAMLDVEKGANKYTHPDHSGDVTSLADGVTTITDEAVKLDKMAKLPSKTIIGNDTDNPAIPKALTKTELLTMLGLSGGGSGYVHPDHSGDVVSLGDGATTITDSVVSLAKMSNLPTNTIIGNNTDNEGVPKALTKAEIVTWLGITTGVPDHYHPGTGANSVALGYNSKSGGLSSTAIGATSTASGGNSTALGYKSEASGLESTALGYNSTASNSYSTALGQGSKAGGARSTALGDESTASGVLSTALGTSSSTSGSYSTALGYQSTASGGYSTALGYNSEVPEASTNTMQLGSTGTDAISSLKCEVALTVTSDIRDKTDIINIPTSTSLDFINKLEPIQYVSNDRSFYLPPREERTKDEQDLLDYYGLCDIYNKEDYQNGTLKGERKRVGLSAQQIQNALADVFGTADYANIVDDNLHDIDHGVEQGVENQLSVAYQNIIPFLIGAIKDQQNQIITQNIHIENQQIQIDELKTMVGG